MSEFDIEYEVTKDGDQAARIGDVTYMAIPGQRGLRVAHVSSNKPLDTLTRADALFVTQVVDDLNGFSDLMLVMAVHFEQRAALGRVDGPSSIRTPWGKSQGSTRYADGVFSHHTAGHGGFKVYAKYNRSIPDQYRNDDGWYEEDCEWAKVAVSLPQFFTDHERNLATTTLKNYFPDEYEAVTGEIIPAGQSSKKDERSFAAENADNWVVISALGRELEDGTKVVDCYATKGGERSGYVNGVEIEVEEAKFRVPSAEYQTRSRFGFVIDEDRHERLDEATTAPRI